jgi:GMP synthase-like glutamine amidotransferase
MAVIIGVPERHVSSLAGRLISKYTKQVHKYVKWKIMHIAVLMANTDDSAFAQAHPGDGSKFETLLHELRPDWRVSVYAVKDGQFPTAGAVHDGWIITGSPASVHDQEAWVARLEALIRDLVAQKQPLFGACFGHQAIAKALGGVVGDNPDGWAFGLVETEMEGVKIRLYAAHREQVLVLPPGAVAVGGNAECPVGAFAMPQVLTTQYHPEMTPEFVAALVAEYAPKLPADAAARARASLAVAADRAVIAARIVRFFEGG